jgi:hypothetical protein
LPVLVQPPLLGLPACTAEAWQGLYRLRGAAGQRDGLLMDIYSDVKRVRLRHGCPPMFDGIGFDLRRLGRTIS